MTKPEAEAKARAEVESVRTVCSYCGVGCGILLDIGRDASTGRRIAKKVSGDRTHPANFGRLCTKGATSADMMAAPGRAAKALIRAERGADPVEADVHAAITAVAGRLRAIVDEHGPDALALYVSGQMSLARTKAFVILDGTLLPIDRIAADTPYHSGKHQRHGMNIQVLTDPFGRLLWASPALPGSTHDLTAARTHGIVRALTDADLKCWADKAYQGADGSIRVPFRGRRLKRWQRRHNSTHAKIRCLGEQAMATLKSWRLLRKLRCSTNRITAIIQAVLVLHHASA